MDEGVKQKKEEEKGEIKPGIEEERIVQGGKIRRKDRAK